MYHLLEILSGIINLKGSCKLITTLQGPRTGEHRFALEEASVDGVPAWLDGSSVDEGTRPHAGFSHGIDFKDVDKPSHASGVRARSRGAELNIPTGQNEAGVACVVSVGKMGSHWSRWDWACS